MEQKSYNIEKLQTYAQLLTNTQNLTLQVNQRLSFIDYFMQFLN